MSEEVVREIVNSIVEQKILENWLFYVLILLVSLVGSYAGSYIKTFASEKAKNRAILSDLEQIKIKLRETTKVTEGIKSDLEHEGWRKRLVEQTKREKLEEYFRLIFEGKEGLHSKMINAFFYREENYDKHALNKASILQKLYFPELAHVQESFDQAVSTYLVWIAKGQELIVVQMQDGAQKPTPPKEHMEIQSQVLTEINAATSKLIEAGKAYAVQINA